MSMKCIFILILTMSYTSFLLSSDEYALAHHCPDDYFQARESFLNAARNNNNLSVLDSLVLQAKGPKQSPLTIDIAVLGDLKTAKKILFHISGTHGVEGASGSGIQHYYLSHSNIPSKDQAIVFIHTLNPFGMAWNRRVNENNVDLNRNCIDLRQTSSLYSVIDPVINPKELVPFNYKGYKLLCDTYETAKIRSAILQGQYDFPEGLFYGGKEIEEGPFLVLQWCQSQLLQLDRNLEDLKIGIIDVHTGLGPYAYDTLITVAPPTNLMEMIFGEKMNAAKQMATVGYQATGVFAKRLAEVLIETSKCDPNNLFVIGQEFGTVDESQVISALYIENMYYHHAKRLQLDYDPESKGGAEMLKAFYPNARAWKHQVVLSGQELIEKSFKILDLL